MKPQPDPEKIVKCACGLPMRQKNWRDHWYACPKGSAVEVTEIDVQNLLAYEARRQEQSREHEAWLQSRRTA